jgi:hypothetical protein
VLRRPVVAAFLYRCPLTGKRVQALAADGLGDDDLVFIPVTCVMCAGGHMLNPKTGRVLGAAEDD